MRAERCRASARVSGRVLFGQQHHDRCCVYVPRGRPFKAMMTWLCLAPNLCVEAGAAHRVGQHRAHPVGIGGCRERQQGYGLAVEDRWEPSTTKLWGTLIRAIVSLV